MTFLNLCSRKSFWPYTKCFTLIFSLCVYRRYIRNTKLFTDLVEASLALPNTRTDLGGNAPVMAGRFKKEGLDVLLASTVTPGLREKIDTDIKGVCVHL